MDSDSPSETIVRECWDFMQQDCPVLKVTGSSGRFRRALAKKIVSLDQSLQFVVYKPTKRQGKMDIMNMSGVLSGVEDKETFGKFEKYYHLDNCFSIVMNDNTKIGLIAIPEVTQNWVKGLRALIANKDNLHDDASIREKWLIDAFEKFDKSGDGLLQHGEIMKLLSSLNISMTPSQLKKNLKEFCPNTPDPALNKEKFAEFFKVISTREEIVQLMNKYTSAGSHLTPVDLMEFLKTEQKMRDITEEDCANLIEIYEPTHQGQQDKHLGIDGFTRYLLTSDGDIFNPKHDQVYQDMTQPLTHYFIASSHNTYLLEDQLKGPSSVEAYINAFKKGCRCVELDCWDGENGEPVIYHGHTLTSKILFKDVIKVVNDYAFVVSDYPVILSLENHCDIKNQKAMAKHLVDILGDKLYTDPVGEECSHIPSPASLKNKILIKGKKLSKQHEMAEDEEDTGEVSEEDEAEDIDATTLDGIENNNAPVKPSTSREKKPKGKAKPAKKAEERTDKDKKGFSVRRSFRSVGKSVAIANQAFGKEKEKKHKKLKLAKELSVLVNYVQSTGFKGFEYAKENGKCYQISSFAEKKMSGLVDGSGSEFVEYNKRQLSRIYPAGGRVDSSNYNPQKAWNAGCQIVALNYQTSGQMMDMNQGKFRQNGRAGYILKPALLRGDSTTFDPNATYEIDGIKKRHVKIKVISGQQLPKPNGSTKGEIIDPYVDVEVSGLPVDCVSFQTKVIKDNGFNPSWNEEFSFNVVMPELALIRFAVYDEDIGKDDLVAQFTFPLSCFKPGYRHVHLSDENGNPLTMSSIFVHVSIS